MSGPRRSFAFTLPIVVCLRDLDALGHVNNAVYLTYLETARNRYLFGLRGLRSVADFDFILARTEIDFRSAAALHETLHVALRPGAVGGSSFRLEYEVREAASARLVVEATSVQVSYNYAAGRSVPVPEELRRTLEAERRRCDVPAS